MLVLWLYLVPLRWLLSWVMAVIVHELGHYAAVRFFGGSVLSIRIGGLGCVMTSSPLTIRQQLYCTAAGPALGLCITILSRWLPRIALCAFIQSVFNLLPVYPLDGGRILRLLRNKKEKCLANKTRREYNG